MNNVLALSRSRISDFLDCRRRFQLRTIDRLSWPIAPLEEKSGEKLALGQRFHQLIHRHYLGFPIKGEFKSASTLSIWWQRFESQGPALPRGKLFPELSVTVPIGRQLLTGRFDLLVIGEESLHIYDWKTDARPRSEAELRDDLQTRLYLALAAEGVSASALKNKVDPERISLTYWYVNHPEASVTLQYGQEQHAYNWAYLENIINDIDRQLSITGSWPLTDDLEQCRHCAYQVYCRRIVGTVEPAEWESDDERLKSEQPQLERSVP